MDNQISQKQQYLFAEIIEGNYSGEDFQSYLQEADPSKGADLNKWPMNNLVQAVKQFQTEMDQQTQQQETQSVKPVHQISNSGIIGESPTQTTVGCIKKQKTPLFDKMFTIQITNFSKVEGGIFQRSHAIYTIESVDIKSLVTRRFSDFVWLRDALKTELPGLPIPPIYKKGKVKKFDDKHLTKKMLIMEKFLNLLVRIQQIKTDKIFYGFITIKDPKEFEKFKKQYEKLVAQPLSKQRTLSGELTITTDRKIISTLAKYQAYLKATQPQIKKIYKNFKGAATMLEGASQYFQSIKNNCKLIISKDKQFLAENEMQHNTKNPFSSLQEISSQFSILLQSQAKTFRNEIYATMKYENLYRLNMIDSLDQLAKQEQDYNKAKVNLLKKKQKLFSEGKMDKWGLQTKPAAKPSRQQAFAIMLPKETKEVLVIKQKYALSNFKIFEESTRHTSQINQVIAQQLTYFIEKQTTITESILKMWSQQNGFAIGVTS